MNLVQTDRDALRTLQSLFKAKHVAIDCETTGLNYAKDRLLGFSLAWRQEDGTVRTAYVPVGHLEGLFARNCPAVAAKRILIEVFEHPLLFHNAGFDIVFLKQLYPKAKLERFFDTRVAARLLGLEAPGVTKPSVALLALHMFHCGKEGKQFQDMKRERGKFRLRSADQVCEYAENDARMTYELAFELLSPAAEQRELWAVEQDFIRLLSKMSARGLLLDREFIERKRVEFTQRMHEVARELRRKGLREVGRRNSEVSFLHGHLKLSLPETEGGSLSVAKGVLEEHKDIEEVALILEWRELMKAMSSWLDPFPLMTDDNRRLHPHLDAAGTVSSRISCSEPNLQAVPMSDRGLSYGSLKGMFTAPPGFALITFDYKQADLRVATMYAKENRMAAIFASGEDPYVGMAEAIWRGEKVTPERRFLAKRVSLATVNAIGAWELAKNVRELDEEEAERLLKQHRKIFPGFVKASRYCAQYVKGHGFIPLWTGRKLTLHDTEDTELRKKSYSRLVQGGVAEMVKKAMIDVNQLLWNKKSALSLQIHDSLVLEMAESERSLIPDIQKIMAHALPHDLMLKTNPPTPMIVEVGRWS